MSLLKPFKLRPIATFRPGILNRWRGPLNYLRPFLDLRSRAFVPGMAAFALLGAMGFQLACPEVSTLPLKTDLAPRRVRIPAAASAADYPAILNIPIFAPDRAPDLHEMAIAGGMAGYALLGTAVAEDIATAIVRTPSGTIERVRPGEYLDGWKLVSVTQRDLMLENNHEHRILTVIPSTPVLVAPSANPASLGDADDQSHQTHGYQNNGLSP
jgi:hypothetical protein